jgi:type VII secretion integral membrane protein EccD
MTELISPDRALISPRRVTVVAPTARVDVSLPQQSTVAELVPILVRMTAGERAGTGWTLGRLGAEPLDGSSTVAGAGIRDGELLYLNTRDARPAPLVVDDVVDAIASTAAEPRGIWRPALTRALGLAVGFVTLAGAGVLVAAVRPAWPLTSVVDGALALVLLLGAAALARAEEDPWVAATLAGAGVPASFFAGVALGVPDGSNPFTPRPEALAFGCAVLVLYAVLAAAAVVHRFPWSAGVTTAAGIGFFAALIAAGSDAPPMKVAAVVAAGTLALSPLLPVTALRLGRLPLPRVPVDVAAFRRDETPTLGPEVADRTRTASDVLGGLLAGVALVVTGATVVLVRSDSGWAWALAGLSGFAMLLRARAYTVTTHRGALVMGGVATLMIAAPGLAASGPPGMRPALIAGVLLLGVVGLAYGARARINQPSPYWTRLLDVLEVVTVVSLLPLAAGVLGLYQAARGLGG